MSRPTKLLALLPFLVKGALSLSILRALRARGTDVTLAFYMPEAVGYTRDPADDFAADDRLIDMTSRHGPVGAEYLEGVLRTCQIPLLVQIGAPQAYAQIPYLKECVPNLRVLDTLYNPVGHVVNHFLYETAFDGVIVESVAMRDFVIANSRQSSPSIHLVESGIDLEEFAVSTRDTRTPSPFTLGYVGRMSPEKNPLGFVKIAEELLASMPGLRFRMFGEGGMSDQVRERAASGPARAAIEFLGYAPHARDALHAIDVLVVPSTLDGRPNSVMEANACGVPVIGAPVGGIPELILDGVNGYIVAPNEYGRFADIVRGWLDAPDTFDALRRSSRETAVERFDRCRMLDAYAAVFAGTSPGEAEPAASIEHAPFRCSVCGGDAWNRRLVRGDSKIVVFCTVCGMGVLEDPPASTETFYEDGYYGAPEVIAYEDYGFTASHALLWTRLMIEALRPEGGRVLDVGCADGFLLASLQGRFDRYGIEVNPAAAANAAAQGVAILSSDIADPAAATWGQFDVVTAMATLEHVLDIRHAVATIIDRLAPDGIFIYEVPLISDVADNKDWLNGSYEHVFYPTVRGMEALFATFPDVLHAGFETAIRGFSVSYIGLASRSPTAFERAEGLLNGMKSEVLAGLDDVARRLNLAYHVVHGFRPTPERVLALPDLLAVASDQRLLKRLTQLWYDDSWQAAQAVTLKQALQERAASSATGGNPPTGDVAVV